MPRPSLTGRNRRPPGMWPTWRAFGGGLLLIALLSVAVVGFAALGFLVLRLMTGGVP